MIKILFIRGNSEHKILLSIILISIVLLFLIIKKLSDGFLYNYLSDIKSKTIEYGLIGLHWGGSILIALVLPELLFTKHLFFQELFIQSQFWNIFASLLILLMSAVVISLVLNLLFNFFLRDNSK